MKRFPAKSQETARYGQVAPIGNRLYRRLAAGHATKVACQYGNEQNRPSKKISEDFCLTPK